MWTDVIIELREHEEDTNGVSLVHSSGAALQPTAGGPEAPEDSRRREMENIDFVHTVDLPAFVKNHLERAIVASGGNDQFQQDWLINVDKDVFAGFVQLEIM